jgi:hypothetical protein
MVNSSFKVVWNEAEDSFEYIGGRGWRISSVKTSGRARRELLARKPANASRTAGVNSGGTLTWKLSR